MKLLPLLCLLSAGFGPASAGETCNSAESDVTVAEGEDVLLPCAPLPEYNIVKFEWQKDKYKYKDKKEVFFYDKDSYKPNTPVPYQDDQFKGRVEFFKDELDSGNASIKIRNTSWKDSGTYTCGVLKDNNWIILNITLNVVGVLKIRENVNGAARKPYVQIIHDQTTWKLLNCEAKGIPEPEVEWRNSTGKVLAKHVPKNNSQVELQLTVTKSDTYTCVVTQLNICHQINNTQNVIISEYSTGLVVTIAVVITALVLLLVFGIIIAKYHCKSRDLKAKSEEKL